MAMSDWTIIRRSLSARLFATITTVAMVAVAVGLMLLLITLRDAGRSAFQRGAGTMHLLVSADSSPLVSVLNGLFYANAPRRPLTWAQYQTIANSYPLDYAIPTQLGDSFQGLPVLATVPEFFTKFQPDPRAPWSLASGAFFSQPFEVVAGADAARTTGLRVGDTLFLTHGIAQSRQLGNPDAPAPHVHREFSYRVVGVLEPSGTSHDRALFTDLESAWVIHAHDRRTRADVSVKSTTSADLLDSDRLITGIFLRLATRAGSDVPANLPQVFDRLRRDPTLVVASPADEIGKLLTIIGSIDQIFIAIAAVVMLSSGITIMLALASSMAGRRREIAVLRVLGASRVRIFGLVMTESAFLGLLGALAGVACAAAGGQIAAGVLRAHLGLVVEPTLEITIVVLIIAATIVLSVGAGIVPSVMAYRTPVAKNLKPLG